MSTVLSEIQVANILNNMEAQLINLRAIKEQLVELTNAVKRLNATAEKILQDM